MIVWGIILTHRIGVILTVVSTGVSAVLPRVLTEEADKQFLEKMSRILQRITWIGLTILVISGILRLQFVSPPLIWLKLIMVSLTLLWTSIGFYYKLDHFPDIQLLLILLTAVTGLII